MQLEAKSGNIKRLGTALGVKKRIDIAAVLGVSPSSIRYSEKKESVSLEWIFTLLHSRHIAPGWVLKGRQPFVLENGFDLETPWPDLGHSAPDFQLERLRLLFPGLAEPHQFFSRFPETVSWKRRSLPGTSFGEPTYRFLWCLFHFFRINPWWIIKGLSPAIYFGKGLDNFNHLNFHTWSLNHETSDSVLLRSGHHGLQHINTAVAGERLPASDRNQPGPVPGRTNDQLGHIIAVPTRP